jgi:hypothetical protein
VGEAARRAGEQTAEQAERFGRAAADTAGHTGEQIARVGADAVQRNAEVMQDAWRSSLDIATNMTQRSADQFARAFGFSGDEGQQAMQQSAHNVEAILQSTGAVAQGMTGISREWFDFLRRRMETNMNRMDELWRCRTPQDLLAVHSDLMRDNVEGMLETSRRVADMSQKVADTATKKMTETIDKARRAA